MSPEEFAKLRASERQRLFEQYKLSKQMSADAVAKLDKKDRDQREQLVRLFTQMAEYLDKNTIFTDLYEKLDAFMTNPLLYQDVMLDMVTKYGSLAHNPAYQQEIDFYNTQLAAFNAQITKNNAERERNAKTAIIDCVINAMGTATAQEKQLSQAAELTLLTTIFADANKDDIRNVIASIDALWQNTVNIYNQQWEMYEKTLIDALNVRATVKDITWHLETLDVTLRLIPNATNQFDAELSTMLAENCKETLADLNAFVDKLQALEKHILGEQHVVPKHWADKKAEFSAKLSANVRITEVAQLVRDAYNLLEFQVKGEWDNAKEEFRFSAKSELEINQLVQFMSRLVQASVRERQKAFIDLKAELENDLNFDAHSEQRALKIQRLAQLMLFTSHGLHVWLKEKTLLLMQCVEGRSLDEVEKILRTLTALIPEVVQLVPENNRFHLQRANDNLISLRKSLITARDQAVSEHLNKMNLDTALLVRVDAARQEMRKIKTDKELFIADAETTIAALKEKKLQIKTDLDCCRGDIRELRSDIPAVTRASKLAELTAQENALNEAFDKFARDINASEHDKETKIKKYNADWNQLALQYPPDHLILKIAYHFKDSTNARDRKGHYIKYLVSQFDAIKAYTVSDAEHLSQLELNNGIAALYEKLSHIARYREILLNPTIKEKEKSTAQRLQPYVNEWPELSTALKALLTLLDKRLAELNKGAANLLPLRLRTSLNLEPDQDHQAQIAQWQMQLTFFKEFQIRVERNKRFALQLNEIAMDCYFIDRALPSRITSLSNSPGTSSPMLPMSRSVSYTEGMVFNGRGSVDLMRASGPTFFDATRALVNLSPPPALGATSATAQLNGVKH